MAFYHDVRELMQEDNRQISVTWLADQYSLCGKIRAQKFFCGRTHYENYREKARKKRATQTRPHGAQIGQNQ
jgi:hypothetical protein